MSKRLRACWGKTTGFQSSTEVITVPLGQGVKNERKKGETLFPPVQTLVYRLFLFLCGVIFIEVIKASSVLIAFTVSEDLSPPLLPFRLKPSVNTAMALDEINRQRKLREKYLPPSRSISNAIIFIAAAIIFIFVPD